METGKIIKSMERARRHGLMAHSISVLNKMDYNMVSVYGFGQMVALTKATGSKAK